MSEERPTTKVCPTPGCGNTQLVMIRTCNIKVCPDCNIEIPWFTDEGQKELK